MTKTRLLLHVVLVFLVLGLQASDWRGVNWEEDNEFKRLFKLLWEENDPAGWEGMERLPSHVFFEEMRTVLPSATGKPEVFQRLRGMMLARPDWESWMQWKIDKNFKHWESRKDDPHRAYMQLMRIPDLLRALGTVETIPFLARFAINEEIPVKHYGKAFQRGGITNLASMRIPGSPDSRKAEPWLAWWKKNEPLYQKDKDGKIHGPAPTVFLIMNGKLPPRFQTNQYDETATIPFPATPEQPTAAAPIPPVVRNWKLPAAIIAGVAVVALVLARLQKQRRK